MARGRKKKTEEVVETPEVKVEQVTETPKKKAWWEEVLENYNNK
jgi:hypothetical protein